MSSFNFSILDNYKDRALNGLIDLQKEREKILGNDRIADTYRKKQLEEANEEAEETVQTQLDKLADKYDRELESLKIEWQTTEEHTAETPAVQERLGDTKNPLKLWELFQDIINSDEPMAYKEMAYRLISNRLKGQEDEDYLERVENLRREELLSEDEQQSLRVFEVAEKARGTIVEGFSNAVMNSLDNIKREQYDHKDIEELKEDITQMVEPYYSHQKKRITRAGLGKETREKLEKAEKSELSEAGIGS